MPRPRSGRKGQAQIPGMLISERKGMVGVGSQAVQGSNKIMQ